MQKLHLIGFTTDLDGLIFSARRGTKSGGFTVEIDDDLIRTIEEVMRLRADGESEWEEDEERQPTAAWRVTVPQPESVLTPREIQARLRTGVSLAEVAEEAGVDEDWVARFAPPVWAEQSRIIATAQRLTFDKPRVGLSAEPLGASVRRNLIERGNHVDDDGFEAAWGAYHVSATTWVVTFDPPGRTRRQVAMWQLDTAAETVTAANRSASDLGYTTGKNRRKSRQDGANEETLARVARSATKKSAARQEAAAKKASDSSKARKKKAQARTAKRPTAVKAPARKAAPKKTVKPAPKKSRKSAAKKAAAKKSAAKKATPKRVAKPAKKGASTKKATKSATKKRVAPPARLLAPPAASQPAVSRPPVFQPVDRAPEPRPATVRAEEAKPSAASSAQNEAAAAAAREERRRLREERRAAAVAAVAREQARDVRPREVQPPRQVEPSRDEVAAPPVRVAPPAPVAEERRPAPPVIAAAVASDEASGRVVRIHANRATGVPAESAPAPRRTRSAERRRRRMFRSD